VVVCAGGYPGPFQRGHEITGVAEASRLRDVLVFHAGVARKGGKLVTNGGRVLNVTGLGPTLDAARETAYAACDSISFDGMQYRRDIAARTADVAT
jgi:phosphoribosylamine---glycine ligase